MDTNSRQDGETGYRVGSEHPTARRPIRAGDLVVSRHGVMGGRMSVIDIEGDVAVCVAQAGVRLRCRVRDLLRIEDLPR